MRTAWNGTARRLPAGFAAGFSPAGQGGTRTIRAVRATGRVCRGMVLLRAGGTGEAKPAGRPTALIIRRAPTAGPRPPQPWTEYRARAARAEKIRALTRGLSL